MLRLPLFTRVEEAVVEERDGPGGGKYPVTINRVVIHPARWDFAAAARICETGLEMMRLAAGLPTEQVVTDETAAAADELDAEERDDRLLELLERARTRRAALLEADQARASGQLRAV